MAGDLKLTGKDCLKFVRKKTNLGRNCAPLKGQNPPWKGETPRLEVRKPTLEERKPTLEGRKSTLEGRKPP